MEQKITQEKGLEGVIKTVKGLIADVEMKIKQKSDETWIWYIKDTDRRKLPLTNKLVAMLAGLQSSASEHNPYVFVPAERYQAIQRKREAGNWTVEHGKRPLNNFNRLFKKILSMAGLCGLTFHDIRRTCLSRWIEKGLSEFEVMNLAGHSTFETTRKFYLAVNNNIVDRARATFDEMPKSDSVANLLQRPFSSNEQRSL
ncbi:MAG: tyrosine-type recombinase/integrase [Anaerohalosphaeraceae bacterium]|nr:tyrosine-type recombinase/integrase [Anaerohalosphaeraceae bacterium]